VNGNLQVGPWLVEPSLNSISRNVARVRLEPKLTEVLVCLAAHPGEPPPLMLLPATAALCGSGLRTWVQGNPASPTMVAEIYAHLGDTEAAFQWLEKAYPERDGFLVGMHDPRWQPLHSDPRYKDLVQRVGLPQ
jgi:hypothetical protein